MASTTITVLTESFVATPFPKHPETFQRDLLQWYRAHRRRLPWREQPSLYRTVVSEVMTQQTRIKTMLPYFDRWMKALPDFASVAAAEEATVLRLWEGLGYYARARNLHRLARSLVGRPAPPDSVAAWQELPGIGAYTAAAIGSIAQNLPVACVDGNVVRILARLTANDSPFRDSGSAARALTPLAEAVLDRDDPGDHNQAMMELGATICHRSSPVCTRCPVRHHCAAAARGDPESYPRLVPKKTQPVAVTRAWCVRDNQILLQQIPATAQRLGGQFELPSDEYVNVPAKARIMAVKKRSITRYRMTETIRAIEPPRQLPPSLQWIDLGRLASLTLSGPHRRWITQLLDQRHPPGH